MGKIFKAGKYKGKPVEWVYGRDRNYYYWAINSAPNLIKDDSVKPQSDDRMTPLQPNLNFLKEGLFATMNNI